MTGRSLRVRVRPDLELAVDVWDGAGRGFLLVHGLASNRRLWDGVARNLAERGHRVVSVDQRGHGQSDAPDTDYAMATFVDDLRRLVEHLDLMSSVWVGQSFGGNVVVESAAVLGPPHVHAVAGVDGGSIELSRMFDSWEACRAALRPPPLAGTPASQVRAWLDDAHPDWPEEGIEATMANFAVQEDGTVRPHLTLEHHLEVLRALWEHRPSARWSAIDVPLLLLFADTDDGDMGPQRARAAAEVADALGDDAVAWMTGDHDLHAQHPAAVADLLLPLAS